LYNKYITHFEHFNNNQIFLTNGMVITLSTPNSRSQYTILKTLLSSVLIYYQYLYNTKFSHPTSLWVMYQKTNMIL